MGLQVWLPLNGSLNNQGLSNATITNNGATINTSGKIGNCYSFDGTDDYISITSDDLYQVFKGGTQHFTIAFWVYHNDSTRGVIFGDYGLTGAINFNIELREDHGVRFYWNSAPDKQFSDTVTAQGWTHIAIIYDGSKVNLYKNGVLSSDVYTGVLATKNKTSGAFRLGRDNRTGATVLNGKLNDFRIYDTALSPREVKEISKGLVLHYPLNNGGFGQDNLALDTHEEKSCVNSYRGWTLQSDAISSILGNVITVSADIKASVDNVQCDTYLRKSDSAAGSIIKIKGITTEYKRYSVTFTATTDADIVTIAFRNNAAAGANTSATYYYKNVKVEFGSRATPWIPNSADTLYSSLGLNDGIEYDVSGYERNGVKTNITYSSDTTRYNTSSVFNGTSSKITTFKPDFIKEEVTFSFWAYMDNWGNGALHSPVSAVEGGGFGMQGNNGAFNLQVGTGSSSVAWITYTANGSTLNSGWHHFAGTYDGFVFNAYIDGTQVYTNTKYTTKTPIFYNTNANSGWLFIGGESGGSATNPSNYFNGKISDVRIYATALSADDVLELYHTPISLSNNGALLTQGEYVES